MSESSRVPISIVLVAETFSGGEPGLENEFTLPAGAAWISLEAEGSVLDRLDDFIKSDSSTLIYIQISIATKLHDVISDLLDYELDALVEFELLTVVSVLEAPTLMTSLLRDSPAMTEKKNRHQDSEESTLRSAELLIERIEFSAFIVLRKAYEVESRQMAQMESLLRRLNPSAKVVASAASSLILASEFIGVDPYDVEKVELSAGWLCQIAGEFDGRGEENGVDSFSYRAHRPFHPERLGDLLQQFDLPGMVRGSGRIWIATRHNEMGVLSLTTGTAWMVYGGVWFAAMPASGWPADSDAREAIMESWILPFGDRCQELAFIGFNMDIKSIREQLNLCLLSDDEMRDGPDSWRNFSDPLPEWYGTDEDESSEQASDGSGQLS